MAVTKKLTPSTHASRSKALMGAALSLPAISSALPAHAQSAAEEPMVKFFYGDYDDRQQGASRMHITAPMVYVRSPLSNNFEAEGSFVWDSMSGASPYYHNTLTGASGLGVEDIRRAGDLKVTKYFDEFSIATGVVASDEDDYTSVGGIVETKIWSEDKNTTLMFGAGGSGDDISSSIQPDLDESRTTFNFLVGITQVVDQLSIVQSTMTFMNGDGYYSDPYKTLDNRPHSRDQWAWLTRYNRYVPELEGSLHADYRMYYDSWGVDAHMIELAWYQPLGERFMVRPSIRYYTQGEADFFTDVFPPEEFDHFLTADQRLSSFGSFTTGIKVMADLWYGFSADVGYNYMEQRSEWKLGSGGSDVIVPFTAHWLSVGLTKRF